MTSFRRQERNANRHTERGLTALASSLERDGWIGAITVAADNQTFDGSARIEVGALDLDDAIVVETDGTRPIVHKRTDIPTADDPRAQRLGVAANRVAQLNLDWDAEMLAAFDEAVDLSGLFSDDEIDALRDEPDGARPELYSRKVKSPIYEPSGDMPAVVELYDDARTRALVEQIDAARDLPDDVRDFLRVAAQRHTVIHYNRVADFYAHADAATQRLMEHSALVIIDFQQAIDLGFVRLTSAIAAQYADEHGSAGGDGDDEDLDDDDAR